MAAETCSAEARRVPQPRPAEAILEVAKKAFDPATEQASRDAFCRKYDDTIANTQTWALLHALNLVVKSEALPPWLRQPLMKTLTLVPLRPDGVRGTLEFVFSVHPSTSMAATDAGQPQKRGAAITHEAVALATKLLSSVPSPLTPEAWFEGISGQLFSLLDGEAGPELAKTAAQVVGFGVLGKKQFGAPGTPGWNAFLQPLLQDINPSLRRKDREGNTGEAEPDIVTIGRSRTLVSAQSLETSLCRLQTLILSNPSPGLCRRALKPVTLQLWSLSSWAGPAPASGRPACGAALSLIETYLRLFGDMDSILLLVNNMAYAGSMGTSSQPAWGFRLNEKGAVEIGQGSDSGAAGQQDLGLGTIEQKADSLVDVLTKACSNEAISSVFLHLLRRWIDSGQGQRGTSIQVKLEEPSDQCAMQELVEVTLLQRLMDKTPEKLVGHFDQLLDIICQVLAADGRSALDDDLVAVVLSLANLVITAPSFQRSDIKPEELRTIEEALERLAKEERGEESVTAHNLAMLLNYRDEMEAPGEAGPGPSVRQVEDRRTYSLAMSYMTGDSSNPPPVVSEGLDMLSSLIVSESPILDITAVAVLMSNLLKENEDYINLRVVKMFTQLANKHPKTTMKELLDNYLDAQEKASTDVRLRFGEALVQVIERLGQTFSGDVAEQACETLLSIAGRRGYRPKTSAKQEKEERLRTLKKAAAAAAAGADEGGDEAEGMDESGGLAEEEEEEEEEDRANMDLVAQIVAGWESKRGSEDVRMRASSLSILGTALETNIGGVGPALVSSVVDVCVKVVTLEREPAFGILRRAAAASLLSFVGALGRARERGQSLGFGLTGESGRDMSAALEYVAQTDNDGLVRQHARDVVEGLESWQVGRLAAAAEAAGAGAGAGLGLGLGLTRLAGLRVGADGAAVEGCGRRRPRIEEVE